jgi:rhodanese-related sulfurtransferase
VPVRVTAKSLTSSLCRRTHKLSIEARASSYSYSVTIADAQAAKQALQGKGSFLLDVRSPYEANKVPIIGAVNVPYTIEDPDMSPAGLLKKALYLGSCFGWWNGGTHMLLNNNFVAQVEAAIPNKAANVVVGCQTSQRSLSAANALINAGYSQISWLEKGYDKCAKGEDKLPTKDDVDIRYAGIGGVSEVLGWTKVQEEEGKAIFGGTGPVFTVFGVLLALDLAWGVYLRQPPA